MSVTDGKSKNIDHTQIFDQSIEHILEPRSRDLGGFSVNRVLPFPARKKVGPWVFFDHMGPVDFKPGEGIDVRPHPHINLATVTYLFEGHMMHRDSVGSVALIKPGDVNLMVAGKGIVHSERTSDEHRASGQRMNGLQLWLALPEADEEIEPAFYHYDTHEIPSALVNDVAVRVMIGEAFGLQSPVKSFARTLYVEIKLTKGQCIELPLEEELAFYLVDGKVQIQGRVVGVHHMVVLQDNSRVIVEALENTLLVCIGGETLSERFMFWNFVSSSKARIEQAKDDWKHRKFPLIEGDSDEFIPLPE